MKTIDFSHFIERYIAGEMGEDERLWFEKELEGNENLCSEIDLRKKTDLVLKNQNLIMLRSKLSEIEKRRNETNLKVAVRKTSKPVYLKYVAVLTVLAVIGSVLLSTGKNSGSEELISRLYKTYEPPASQRSGQLAGNADFTLALEFYNTNDYANAALFFSKVVESNPKDMQSVLLNGVSNFEDQKYPEAKMSFSTVIDDNNNLFIETARWYLSLCYIKTRETDKAIRLLQAIIDEKGIYSKDARKILRTLK
jgi:tetratricopeptide (TPR) repeat protein